MLMVLSPAKTLDYESPLATKHYSQPQQLNQTAQLIDVAKQLSPTEVASLMKISDKLAQLNVERFHQWQPEFNLSNARQAILAFKGDVYTGLQASDFSESDFQFAQKNLRILSGLYGVLRPLDLMQPYRLEMGIRLQTPQANNLYQFWGDRITECLNQTLADQKDDTLVNLASDEYFKAVNPKTLQAKIIKPVFLDEKNGRYKVISFYAKKARGLMSRFMIQHQLTSAEALKAFDIDGYAYDEESSQGSEWVFKRAENWQE